MRLNYILWIEDIVRTFGLADNAIGVDIGTQRNEFASNKSHSSELISGCGASCIYPLLAVRQNPTWRMFATEINVESIAYAGDNVNRNQLNDSIELIEAGANDVAPFDALDRCEEFERADFSMCNPPFFNDEHYTDAGEPIEADHKNRTGKRKEANNVKSGTGTELVTSGGEIAFVKRMIDNSWAFSDRIKVFTTMLGHKNSVAAIQNELTARKICNFCSAQFCQGRTMRWAIAWTFRHDLLLRTVPKCGQSTAKKLLRFQIDAGIDFEVAAAKLFTILNELDHSIVDRQQTQPNRRQCHFVAVANSWSKQRRKKRAAAMQREEERTASNGDALVPAKKRLKINCDTFVERSDENGTREIPPHLHVLAAIDRETFNGRDYSMEINLEYLNGCGGVDSAYQLLQFVKNKWKE